MRQKAIHWIAVLKLWLNSYIERKDLRLNFFLWAPFCLCFFSQIRLNICDLQVLSLLSAKNIAHKN
ncbi:hypothetical protein PHSC3_000941 [Chlamydiales bacterium STE3]|nr:hypothetical protein PHSC3_000941 [Chlamydiales bacterium STE3]